MTSRISLLLSALAVANLYAAVQNVTITADNAYAYNAENRLACDSGSRITVKYSYRQDGTTLKAALLDFIDVTPPASGAADPWVSIQLYGDGASDTAGLTNDVDFTGQPYLWLSSNKRGNNWESGKYNVLNGIFTPDGDVYRLGYGGSSWTGESGLLVTNLTDNPVTGAARSILVRGTGTTCFRSIGGAKITLTGSLVVDGSDLCFGAANAFGTLSKLKLTNGGRLVVKNSSAEMPQSLPIEIDGSGTMYVSGGSGLPHLTLKGDLSGTGTLNSKDSGALWFYGTNNTFSGTVDVAAPASGNTKEMRIGDGTRFSWAGSGFTGSNQTLVFNTHSNATIATAMPKDGRVVKSGDGRLTLTAAIDRSTAIAANKPAFEIEGGTLALGTAPASPLSGLLKLSNGTVFDLGGADSCYLPQGTGCVTNGAASVVCAGAPTNDVVFTGTLFGAAVIANAGTGTWQAAPGAFGDDAFPDGVTFAQGVSVLENGVTRGNVTVNKGARLLFSNVEQNRKKTLAGLELDIWRGLSIPSPVDHAAYLQHCVDAVRTRAPDVRTDMTEFPGKAQIRADIPTTEKPAASLPFAKILGNPCDAFTALFSGWFYAEKDGTYWFRVCADDSGIVWVDDVQVVRCAYGSSQTAFAGAIALTAGWHRFRTLFGEEGGWEVFIVDVKRPGETDFSDFRTGELAATCAAETTLAALSGAGEIALAADGCWPGIADASGFTGTADVTVRAAGDVGTLGLDSATLLWRSEGMTEAFWNAAGFATAVETNGAQAVILTPAVVSRHGDLNSSAAVDITGAWRFSFDYQVIQPYPTSEGHGFGDGLFIGLHAAGKSAPGDPSQGREGNKTRMKESSAYGLQIAMYSNGYNEYCWVMTNVQHTAAGPMTTNRTFILSKLCEDPVHVELAYDGTSQLVVTFSRRGEVLSFTNEYAGVDFPERFPSGKAYLGVWGVNGWNWARTMIENHAFVSGTDLAAPVLGGGLELRGGTVDVRARGYSSCPLAADVRVTDATTLAATGLASLAPTAQSVLTFDLANPAAVLTVTGPVAFPAEQTVAFANALSWPREPRLLADFTGATGDMPVFRPSAASPKAVVLFEKDRKLYVFRTTGAAIFVR